MLELTTPDPSVEDDVERIELFSIDGKAYTIPDTVRPNLTLQYLYISRVQGTGIAESFLAEQLLGEEAYLALINFKALKSEQYNEVIKIARAIAFGEVRPKGLKSNGSGARSRTAPAKKPSAKRATASGS